jgi:hypothetical protein
VEPTGATVVETIGLGHPYDGIAVEMQQQAAHL